MSNLLNTIIPKKEMQEFKEYFFLLSKSGIKFILRNDLFAVFSQYCSEQKKNTKFFKESGIRKFIEKIPEMFFRNEYVYIKHRYAVAKYRFYRLGMESEYMEEIGIADYIDIKETNAFENNSGYNENKLRIDLVPFYDYSPSIRDTRHIGNGIKFLNQYMASSIFQEPEKWEQKIFEFIRLCRLDTREILINGSYFKDITELKQELPGIIEWLKGKSASTTYEEIKLKLKKHGIEAGWGNTVKKIVEKMQLFMDLLNEPQSTLLADFISSIPMISKIAIISPHGWFAQENVLGRPDTGGQVIYILDQVKALEKFLTRELRETGIDDVVPRIIILTRLIPNADTTSCNRRLEKVFHTENCWILRVPFKDADGRILDDWISRFHIWPYLDRYTEDSKRELVSEFAGNPHLIIGNYSDGNLVATL
ncbi:MAG: sucrose synthase, partial [Oligoflexia bacterium]|nr:sucrose synthase [Oligoflexia bacterium]